MLGYKPAQDVNGFWDGAVELPFENTFIINQQIQKAVNGEKYFINVMQNGRGKPEWQDQISYIDFLEYYDLWDNFHFFGYPQGLSWLEASNWFNEILKRFENTFIAVQNLKDEKAMKAARHTNHNTTD